MVGLMKQYGYTQKELAAEVGVTEATMSRYINNSRTPKGTVIAAIAYKLHTSNALFGIKATKDWKGKTLTRKTTEYEDGKKVQVEAEFRAYDTWEDSVKDHSAFLKKYKRYAKVIGETDYKEACKAVAAAGYATDPEYAKKLIKLIETYELYNYDTKDTKTDDLGAEDKKYYRVQAGAYRRKEGAELMAEKIRKTGHKDVFVRMINGLYKVQAGAYTDRKNAEKTEKKLKAAGISCFIVCA